QGTVGGASPLAQEPLRQLIDCCGPENDSKAALERTDRRLTMRRIEELRPHPRYARLGISVPSSKLKTLIDQSKDAFLGALEVTADGIIIDGQARWEVARLQKRPIVRCIEYNISESEALHRVLLTHRPSPGLVPFNRVILALGLEGHFRQQARLHQQAGG